MARAKKRSAKSTKPAAKAKKKMPAKKVAAKKKPVAKKTVARAAPAKKPVAKKPASAKPVMMQPKGKWVFSFGDGRADGRADMKNLLGGKGANLAEMSNLGLPVPSGFTITTEVCTYYYKNKETYPPTLQAQVKDALARIEKSMGARFGDADNPLLVSVRSGARVSMPGMMDTVLNLGLNDQTVAGLAKRSGDARFAYDSYRRFIQMYGAVVLDIDHHLFEEILDLHKEDRGITLDTREQAVWFDARTRLVNAALAQPRVFVHRDFMPRNLMPMQCADQGGIGVLDFQDAVAGPIAYDPLSLVKDAFRSWPLERAESWLRRYWERARAATLPVPDWPGFLRDADWIGMQRHLKVIGIFARLKHRDGKAHYVEDVPRFFAYLAEVLPRYPEFDEFAAVLARITPTRSDP